jgi:hypothetical protein
MLSIYSSKSITSQLTTGRKLFSKLSDLLSMDSAAKCIASGFFIENLPPSL